MSQDVDVRLIAATLAAGVIAKHDRGGIPAVDAVDIYLRNSGGPRPESPKRPPKACDRTVVPAPGRRNEGLYDRPRRDRSGVQVSARLHVETTGGHRVRHLRSRFPRTNLIQIRMVARMTKAAKLSMSLS
jgi:hypothetical protein